jgi:CRISPR-associated protein Cas1
MPYKERRDLTVTLTCARCGAPFHPWRDHRTPTRYCSTACAAAKGHEAIAEARAHGHDPTHGGAAADKRRTALQRRKAAGEVFGTPLQQAQREGRIALKPKRQVGVSGATAAVSAQPSEWRDAAQPMGEYSVEAPSTPTAPLIAHSAAADLGRAWLAAGIQYQAIADKAEAKPSADAQQRTLVLSGYGAGLRVERGALVVQQGYTHAPQSAQTHLLHRAMHEVGRIVCCAPKGAVSFDALAWCTAQGITVTILTADGHHQATLSPEPKADARLRRAQYQAQASGLDVQLCRALLQRKVTAQLATLEAHSDLPGSKDAADWLRTALQWLALPEPPAWLGTVDQVRYYEAWLARLYFHAWKGWGLCWGKADVKRIPPHWLVARERNSPLGGGDARHAVDPLNAVLNYAYGCLEGQARQALEVQGFDVACGFLHVDKDGRDSLVYDLMECARGTVDGLVLGFLSETLLHAGDFVQTTDGRCWLHPQLARAVVASCRVAQAQMDEHANWLRERVLLGA